MTVTEATLYGVSVGPGDPRLMTLLALETIERCQVIAAPQTSSGDHIALDIARGAIDLTGKTVVFIPVPMTRDATALDESHAQQARTIATYLEQGQDVALLSLGDVSIYSSFTYVAQKLQGRFNVVMVPGVPSFCAVAAALKTSLTEHDEPLHIIPGGDADEEALSLAGTKVFMKSGKQMHKVCRAIADAGLSEHASLVMDCGLQDQRVIADIDEVPDQMGYLTTVVVKPSSADRLAPGPGGIS